MQAFGLDPTSMDGDSPMNDDHRGPPVLAIAAAGKRFGTSRALAGATLRLDRQEWLGLLGPNGAGKTTLIRAITGRVRLDEGTILLHGRPLDPQRPLAAATLGLGVVPQEIALYPLLTARENLLAFARLSGVRSSELARRVDWALEWTGLDSRAGDRVDTYSGGMKRRLNIACGILHRPQVILLDEPTAGVDPQSRQRIWEMLAELRGEGASLLFTTHQLQEAESVCDRVVIIDRGATVAEGTCDELIRRTVGPARSVVLDLDRPLPDALRRPEMEMLEGHRIRFPMDDLARQLPVLLAELAAAGLRVEDLGVEKPSLQRVFLHLTGSELRE